jgi:hypothetical protein
MGAEKVRWWKKVGPFELTCLPKWLSDQYYAELGWVKGERSIYTVEGPEHQRPWNNHADFDLVSSKTLWGRHRPVLDLDFDAVLWKSSTPGHHHLVLDKELTWKQYSRLLLALEDAGILSEEYVDISLERKATYVRLPWKKKKKEGYGQ